MLFNLILLPIISLFIILLIPRRYLNLIKILTIIFSSFIFFYSLLLFFFFDIYQKYNYKFIISILKSEKLLKFKDLYIDLQFNDFINFLYGINYEVGVDAISILFIILTTLLFPICFLLN
jgi:NADH:ubiquinone oxidoreductase subunit 4 (subunit M)